MSRILLSSQFILLLAIVYFGAQSNPIIPHTLLGKLILLVSIGATISAYCFKRQVKYQCVVLTIVLFSSIIGFLIQKNILPIWISDYFGLFMQFGIAYCALLFFDFDKVPKGLANSKLTKIAMGLVAWQIISGVLLRGENKSIMRLGEKTGLLYYSIHLFLAIFTLLALFCLVFYTLQLGKSNNWFKRWGIILLVMVSLQIILGMVSLLTSFHPQKWQIASQYIRPLHFIASGLIFFVILLFKKGKS